MAEKAEVESASRARVVTYTSAIIIAVASSVYLAVVPFLPAPPVLPVLVGIGLGGLSLRNRGIAIATLYLLVYFSVLWQMIGFGFFQLLSAGVGIVVILALAAPLLPFMTRRVELSSMALAILAVALMLTPAYFISIPLIATAALAFGGFASLEALAGTFIFFLTPFLLLENALYFTTTTGATAPIIFGQFSTLAQNLRPPLPGLNVLLTGLPANYLSHSALPVSTWLSESASVLVIPMVILGVVLVAASSVGGVARNVVEKFERTREITGSLKLILAPLVVAGVVPVVFIILLSLLSRPESGGFQTSLSNDPTHLQVVYMLGSSFLLTTSFIGRESIILRLETVQFGNEGLLSVIDACQERMKDAQALMDKVQGWVPSMTLSPERKSMSEYAAQLADARRQVGGASPALISQIQGQLEANVLAHLTQVPDTMRRRVASEIRGLISATATANNHLDEAKVSLHYAEIPPVVDLTPLDDLVAAYQAAKASIESVTRELSDLYAKESSALNMIMGQEEVNPPVSATVLIESNEIVSAIRLVAEEYWLDFHLRWSDSLDQHKAALLSKIRELERSVSEGERLRLQSVEKIIEAAKPANSTETLDGVLDLKAALDSIVSKTASGADRVGAMLESLELRSVRTLRFETVNRVNEVTELKKRLETVGVSLESITKFLEYAVGVLKSQAEAWKSDRENLVALAQYPLAKKIIQKMFEDQKKVSLSKLPYQKKAAELYAELFASGTFGAIYDENAEVILMKGDNAQVS